MLFFYKKCSSPKIEIPSFIQSRVNKYNHSNSKKSSNSHRLSVGQIIPYSLNYNFNYKYNYNIPENKSYRSNRSNSIYSKNNDKIDSRRSDRKKKELNYKSLFFS